MPPENASALQAALVRLAEDPEARSRMGVNARRYAEKNLDQDAILQRFEAQLSDMILEHRGMKQV